MKAFDPDAMCPKCGHDKINTVYQEAKHDACPDYCKDRVPEHLDRWCDRCRYRWHEACIAPRPAGDAAAGGAR